MDLPKLSSSVPRTLPSASSQADSSTAPPLPCHITPLPSRVARRSQGQQGAISTSTKHHPKLELNLPAEKNQPQSLSVPNSVAPSPTDSVAGGKTKKREQVTPRQRAQLEKMFALDSRCPPHERRKDISAALGMQDQRLKNWFQNRRAKEKRTEQQKQKLPSSTSLPPQPSFESESLPNAPPELTPGFDTELNARINEDLPVDIIPCDTLSIGTWKRLRSEEAEHSLLAYVSYSRECLTWFIHNAASERSFKMIIPFHTIMHTELDGTSSLRMAAGPIEISFVLSRPPLFFFEAKIVDPGTMATIREWQESHDWTEDRQGTYCLRHTIRGPAIALHRFLETLQTKLAFLDRKADLRRRPISWHQSPSYEYSRPTPQGSINPLEMRKRLPPAEVFETYSPEASTQSTCSGPMGYYYRSRIPDSATCNDQPSPSFSEDQPSPTAPEGDQPSPQATTLQYISLDGSPVPEASEPSLVLASPPIVPPIARLHQDSPMVIARDYQHHTPPPPRSGLEPMNGCITGQASAVPSNSAGAFLEPSPGTAAHFSNSSFTPIPVTARCYTLDYGLATGCSSSTGSLHRSTRSSESPSTFLTQPQYKPLPAGSLGTDASSYYFPTSANHVLSSTPSSTLPPPPPATFNRLDLNPADIPSSLTATDSFYAEAPAATASTDPGLNPDLFQLLQQPLQQHQQPQHQLQHQKYQQPALIAPTSFSASTYCIQGDWFADLQQWQQKQNHNRDHQQHL